MPFLDIVSRKAKYQRQEDKLRRQRGELIDDGERSRNEADHRARLLAYEEKRKEIEFAEETEKLRRRQEIARKQALEKEEEKMMRDAAYQAGLARKQEEELGETRRKHDQEIRRLEAAQFRQNDDVQVRLAEEIRQREQIMQRLRQKLKEQQEARRFEEARQLNAKRKIEEQKRKIELQKEEQSEKILQAEKKRQRDYLINHNSPKALQELRELIRGRYELDMEIYRMRNMGYANRDLVIKRMVRSDEILQKIRSIVVNWTPESGFDAEEWRYAEDIKERLLAEGKRIWAVEPPWPADSRPSTPGGTHFVSTFVRSSNSRKKESISVLASKIPTRRSSSSIDMLTIDARRPITPVAIETGSDTVPFLSLMRRRSPIWL